MSASFALIPGEGASPQALSRESERVETPPHPDPLHSPSKTGVNALMASGEREKKRRHQAFSATTNQSVIAPRLAVDTSLIYLASTPVV